MRKNILSISNQVVDCVILHIYRKTFCQLIQFSPGTLDSVYAHKCISCLWSEGEEEVTSSSGSQPVCCVAVLCVQCSRCGSYASHMEACGGASERGQGEIPARGCEPRQLVGWPVTRSREESNDLHSQTNTVAHLHNNKAGAGGDVGTRWKSRTGYTKYEKYKFPLQLLQQCFPQDKRLFYTFCLLSGSIVAALLILEQKTQCHRTFSPVFTACEKPSGDNDDRQL